MPDPGAKSAVSSPESPRGVAVNANAAEQNQWETDSQLSMRSTAYAAMSTNGVGRVQRSNMDIANLLDPVGGLMSTKFNNIAYHAA